MLNIGKIHHKAAEISTVWFLFMYIAKHNRLVRKQ